MWTGKRYYRWNGKQCLKLTEINKQREHDIKKSKKLKVILLISKDKGSYIGKGYKGWILRNKQGSKS